MPKEKERVLVATTDGQNIYHQISIIQKADGSFYCNFSDQPHINGRNGDHASYHATGLVNFKFGGKLVNSTPLIPPSQLKGIFTFPSSPTHNLLLSRKTPFSSIGQFNPSAIVYVKLDPNAEHTTNIFAFLVDSSRIDFIKLPFLFEASVDQIQIITRTTPWIIVMVTQSPKGVTSAGPPAMSNQSDRSAFEEINEMYFDKFFK